MAKPEPDPTAEVDAQLARYRAMRDFTLTAEPAGGAGKPRTPEGGLPFVIQKHAATRLHYDFRLGWSGVLKSWACAKGPSYNTADRRLAVQVEDHPLEYGGFEGTIPKGEYGGGTVMLWDQGTWEPLPGTDVEEGLKKGSLKFTLHGQKLEGRWTLVRMHPHPTGPAAKESKPNWLLIKERDGLEHNTPDRSGSGPGAAPPITESAPNSVLTGRDLAQIAAAQDHIWHSKPAEASSPANHSRLRRNLDAAHLHGSKPAVSRTRSASASKDTPAAAHRTTLAAWLESTPEEPPPPFLPPQLASPAQALPTGAGWLHELKLDGYRLQAHIHPAAKPKQAKRVTLYTRSGLDWTHRMPSIAAALQQLPVAQAILDGELVVLDAEGKSSFSQLQAVFEQAQAAPLTYFAFDLLHLDSHNLRDLPLVTRKSILQPLLTAAAPAVLFNEHLTLAADQVLSHACQVGAEGIVSKQSQAPYRGGRSTTWLKHKCTHRQEFVIGGYTLPKDSGPGVGALLLGYYQAGKLVHCGRCGTGFSQAAARALRHRLDRLQSPQSPFATLRREQQRDALWVRPTLACEVQFAAWTADGSVRHASFQGMRTDKPTQEIVREQPAVTAPEGSQAGSSQTGPPESDLPLKTPQNPEPQPEQAKAPRKKLPTPAEKPQSPTKTTDKATSKATSKATDNGTGKATGKATSNPTSKPNSQSATKTTSNSASQTSDPTLTHPGKLLDPLSGTTKQQLADYLLAVAPAMLPHLAGRPVSIVRCPSGSASPCFFQKHAKAGLPPTIGSLEVPDKPDSARSEPHTEPYITLDTPQALASLAQLSVLELHPWGSRAPALEQPDRFILDLDPDESLPWTTLVESAHTIRAFLADLQLESWVKTTGGKGLHLVVPLVPSIQWPEFKRFARGIAAAIASTEPTLYLIKMTKAARKGRIFIDWMRNERGATAVAPWSPRARAGMRVAAPLAWDELSAGNPTYSVSNLDTWKQRLTSAQNPWAKMPPQTLAPEVVQAVLAQQK